ncbi:MAG: PEP-CTERM sorting domain-containing protein [Aquabacterium sp.]|uniref:PEP-CTERM sorting domain-containing protein n=1 Tax=Aquabacterium sp. TaxID=1872578 RepID=UPI0025B984C2|nr:PEP-CTERM sorting domain-containing protein [Aquabacterium sp.]MBI5925767.1 PEP-CTERM sorting domain-containing protein [Aquabacterium sp.]
MKKFAVAALMLAVSSSMSVANAAPVTVDAATYTLTYDNSFLAGVPSVGVVGDAVTFGGASAVAASPLLGTPSVAAYAIDSYNGNPFPIIVTAKAGYKITGLTETVSGLYNAFVSPTAAGTAMSGAGFQSFWVANDVVQGNSGSQLLANVSADAQPFSASGAYDVSGTLALASSASTVNMSATGFMIFADATGSGLAQTSLSSYKLNVQTAAVPEPEMLGLMLAGLGVAVFSLRRHRVVR